MSDGDQDDNIVVQKSQTKHCLLCTNAPRRQPMTVVFNWSLSLQIRGQLKKVITEIHDRRLGAPGNPKLGVLVSYCLRLFLLGVSVDYYPVGPGWEIQGWCFPNQREVETADGGFEDEQTVTFGHVCVTLRERGWPYNSIIKPTLMVWDLNKLIHLNLQMYLDIYMDD